jgi:hypothetical protein
MADGGEGHAEVMVARVAFRYGARGERALNCWAFGKRRREKTL